MYLRSIGKEHEISTQLEDLDSFSIGDRKPEGIVRNLSFRLRGTSVTFQKEFYVFEMLDNLVDVVFGWQSMAGDFRQFCCQLRVLAIATILVVRRVRA
jgi:hypothetical protein